MSSNYPQSVVKRNLFMHNCEGKCVQIIFIALEDMKVGQGLSEHAIPWFVVVGV